MFSDSNKRGRNLSQEKSFFKTSKLTFGSLLMSVCITLFTGAPVAFKTWWGHQYYGGHNLPPPGWNRVKVAAKTWFGHVPTSTCPQARLYKYPTA